jgi:hypothetical protein
MSGMENRVATLEARIEANKIREQRAMRKLWWRYFMLSVAFGAVVSAIIQLSL